jgi:hypothetical protein
MLDPQSVWVFSGVKGTFPSGVFTDLRIAEEWISRYYLSGVLTKYPVNEGVFDWAVSAGVFAPKTPRQQTPEFIGRFTSASLEHYHYEKGVRVDA